MADYSQASSFAKQSYISPDQYLDNQDKQTTKMEDLEASLVEEEPYQRPSDEISTSYINMQRKKSFLRRSMAPLEEGSLRSNILTMLSGTIGVGLLSLPKALSTTGLTVGIVGLILFGVFTAYTYKILNDLVIESKRKSYANVVGYYFGKRLAGAFVNLTITATLSLGILYGSISWLFLEKLLKMHNLVDFKIDDPKKLTIDEYDPLTVKWRYICSAIIFVFILPFVYQRSISSLKYVSIVVIIAVVYRSVCLFSSSGNSIVPIAPSLSYT
jgi:amino acid permease